MAADLRWHVTFDGRQYEFNAHKDLTVGVLRHIKQWYGPEIGRWAAFILAVGQGDPDAWACVIWIVRRKAGEANVPEPQQMPDFAVGEMMRGAQTAADPTPEQEREAAPPTTDSTETSMSSEADTSSLSPTSAG